MERPRALPIAWVESPLQLVCAAEYATAQGTPVAVALRISGPQMASTAEALVARGAMFASVAPYYGIPWELLAAKRDWVVGDAFSGQFRTAVNVLRPRTLTMVDDGAISIHLARALVGRDDFARPGQHESGLKTVLGGLARGRMRALAARGRAGLFTAFDADPAMSDLAADGFAVTRNDFGWLRSTAQPVALPHPRVVLGTAHVADATQRPADHLAWVRATAAGGPVSYLPHRREPAELTVRIGQLPGVAVVQTGLPVELALAGTQTPLEIITTRSSATTTLAAVLAGTGSTISAGTGPTAESSAGVSA